MATKKGGGSSRNGLDFNQPFDKEDLTSYELGWKSEMLDQRLRINGASRQIVEWSGPWPLVERGWDLTAVRRAHRFQVADETGSAWLLLLEDSGWSIEGGYD